MTTIPEKNDPVVTEDTAAVVRNPWYKNTVFIVVSSAFVLALILKAFIIEAYRIPSSSMEDTLLPGDLIVVNKLAYGVSTPAFIPFIETPVQQKRIIKYAAPTRFDIITFLHPGERDELTPSQPVYYIKRIYALPGETIKITRKKVFINGSELPQGGYVKLKPDFCLPGVGNERIFPRGTGWNEDYYGPLIIPSNGMKIDMTFDNFQKYRLIINREYGEDVLRWSGGKIFIKDSAVSTYQFRHNYYFVMGDNRDDSFDSRFWGLVPEESISGRALFIYMSLEQFGKNFFERLRWNRMFTFIR